MAGMSARVRIARTSALSAAGGLMVQNKSFSSWAGPFFALGTLVFAVGALHFAAPLLIPVGIAVLLTFLLTPLVRWLERHSIPRVLAVSFAVLSVIVAVSGLGWTLAHQANQLLDSFPKYENNLRLKLAVLRTEDSNLLAKLREIARKVDKEISGDATPKPPSTDDAVKVTVIKSDPELTLVNLPTIAGSAAPAVGGAVLCVALLAFMLMRREDLRERVFGLGGRARIPVTTRAMEDGWERITRTLLVQFTANASFGVIYGAGLYVIGIPFAVLWGVLAIALRYVPFVGTTIALALPFAVSVLMMQGWQGPLLVVAWFAVLILVLLAVETWFIGPGIGVSPTATLLMLGFWTWLWGPVALILATPLTACLMVLARFLPQFRFLEVALGDAPVLDAPARLYQRLLSRDLDEAQRLFDEELRVRNCVSTCDGLLRPALLHAAADRTDHRISAREYGEVLNGAIAMLDSGRSAVDANDVQPFATNELHTGRELSVLCIARDELDRVGYFMLRSCLGPQGISLDIGSGKLLLSEAIEKVARGDFDAVCVGITPSGGLFAAKLICRQIRRRFPSLPVLVVHWSGLSRDARERAAMLEAGASAVHGSIDELRLALIALESSTRSVSSAALPEPAGLVAS